MEAFLFLNKWLFNPIDNFEKSIWTFEAKTNKSNHFSFLLAYKMIEYSGIMEGI